ncbi:MAG TPA: glycosyltransferase family 4 protein, partial [Bacteroidota bacterium]|nr:glycosyltransferase family 4 protein [Bacteroidota bacterium]
GQSLNEPDWFHIKPHEIVKDFANPKMKEALEKELFSNDYDVVQYEYLQMAYLINIVKKYNTASVFTEIEVQSRKLWRDMLHASFLEKLDYFYRWMVMVNFENSICSRFDAVVALTKEDARYIQQYNPKLDVRTSPMGIDISFFLPHSMQAERQSLLFVGYFRHPPNVDAMIHFSKDILPLIRKKYPDVKLYIVGGEIPREIQQLSFDNNVVVTGWVDDLRPYYEKATIFIAPIRLGAGMRGKILEAWAMKKPIVSSSVAAEGYHCENGREIFIADEPTMFADAVIQLLGDERLREKIAENGYLRARSEYAWSKIAQQYEELYYHLLNS